MSRKLASIFVLICFLLVGATSCNSSNGSQVASSSEPEPLATQTRPPIETLTATPSSARLQAKPTKTGLPTAIVMDTPPALRSETRIELPGVTLDHWTYYETPLAVWGLAFEGPDILWLEYGAGGLCRLDIKIDECLVFQFDEEFNAAKIVPRDDFDQGVWIGSYYPPAKRYYQGVWTEYPFGKVFAFSSEAIWAADRNLYRIEGEHIESYEKPHGDPISIAVAPDGNVWVSLVTFPGAGFITSKGVWQFDGASWELIPELDDGPENIYHLVTAADGSIWAISEIAVGTNEPGHIKKYDGQKWALDVPNDLWLGGVGETADLDGNLWILTTDATKFDGSKWVEMNYDDEIEDLFSITEKPWAYAIAFSPTGMVCLGTEIGVFCKDQAQ
jgi:hypothetical protein